MPAEPEDLARLAAGFVRALRTEGVAVATDATLLYASALAELDPALTANLYWAGRVTLCRRPEDLPPYERAFAAYFLARPPGEAEGLSPPQPEPAGTTAGGEVTDRVAAVARYSPEERLRRRDFASLSESELAETLRAIDRLRVAPRLRRTRRRGPAPSGSLDLARTLRRALRTGGDPLRRLRRRPRRRARRLVLICDVSASMEPYARSMLRFCHAAVAARPRGEVEAFALGTRLTRLSRLLEGHDGDAALARAAAAATDRSGGTRLGDGIGEFNRRYGAPGLGRGSTVVICSDGWDRGDPAIVEREMARLHRLAHEVIWVNPLKASPGYEPLARGMAAALPHCDAFVAGGDLASLEGLAELVAS